MITRALGFICLGFFALTTMNTAVVKAAPNCAKNPTHPQCDGGDGGGNSDIGNTVVVRVELRDVDGDHIKSGVSGVGTTDCAADGLSQFWLVNENFTDIPCQQDQPIATMITDLTGSVGLRMETHTREDTLGSPPAANRYLTIDFSRGISVPAPGCPDIDTLYDSPDTAPFAPPVNGAPCIDNVEARLVAGSDIFNYPPGTIVEGPNIQIRVPTIRTDKKGNDEFAWFAQYLIEFQSLIVRAYPGPEPSDQTVIFECGGADHDCRARLTEGGIMKGPYATPFVEWGDYELPFQITVRRAFCDSEGLVCDVLGAP